MTLNYMCVFYFFFRNVIRGRRGKRDNEWLYLIFFGGYEFGTRSTDMARIDLFLFLFALNFRFIRQK